MSAHLSYLFSGHKTESDFLSAAENVINIAAHQQILKPTEQSKSLVSVF